MKDHVKESRQIDLEGDVDYVSEKILAVAAGLKEASIQNTSWSGDPSYEIVGWRPMTEQELERQKKRRDVARKAANERLRKVEDKERAELARLQKKYEHVGGLDGHGPGTTETRRVKERGS